MQYKIFGHRKLLRAQRLVAENETLSRFDVIAGLVPKSVTLPVSTETKQLACIGDEEIIEKNNVACIPTKPSVAIPLTLRVNDCDVFIPDRAAFENRLVSSVAKSLASTLDAQIISRTLKIGLHNGHTIVGGEWQSYELVEDKNDRDVLAIRESAVEVHGYAPHELMGLVFLVEYEVGTPAPSQSRFDTQAMIKSLSTVRNGNMLTNVVIGTSVYLPYDGKSMVLKNTDNSSDWEGIELKLRSDDFCGIFSPKPVFVDSVALEEHRAESKRGLKDYDDRDNGPDEVDAMSMNINFKLTAFDAVKGEIEHQDTVAADVEDTREGGTRVFDEDLDDYAIRRSTDRLSASSRQRKPDRSSKVTLSTRRDRRDLADDDDESIAESLVGGDSNASSLRIDSRYYASGRVDKYADESVVSDEPSHIAVPKDRGSLLARTMQAPLAARGKGGHPRGRDDMLDDADPYDHTTRAIVSRDLRTSREFRASSEVGFREITRGAKARLGRYGFDGVVQGGGELSASMQLPKNISQALTNQRRPNVDVELEMRDPLSLHDVSIQFAGYRAGNREANKTRQAQVPHPRTVYFSYQFYTCQATRTEVMRLLPADKGQLCVLVRDEAHTRDEPPLSLRYVVDCSLCSPTEPAEFSEYLASKSLLIDVWDADSLILIGTCYVPLRRIMRQGEASAKCALECDVVNGEMDAQTHGGITSSVISSGGGMSGQVVGSVHVILSNFGQPGRGMTSFKAQSKTSDERLAREGGAALNWRIQGLSGGRDPSRRGLERPKNSVRAKPLSESAPELSQVLNEYRHSAEGSMRSLTALRGGEGVHTLTYDEVVMLFKLFEGNVKKTVQYVGPMLQLLDVPSYSVALRKIIKAYQAYGDDVLLDQDMMNFADARGFLSATNIGEFTRSLFEKLGTKYRSEEVALLSEKLGALSPSGAVKPQDVIAFCRNEAESQEWAMVGKRFRRAVQDATLNNSDVEQMLSDADANGDHHLSAVEFKDFLAKLSKLVKLTPRDITLTVKHFTNKAFGSERKGDPVSLKEVMAYLGKKYLGKLEVRLAESLLREFTVERVTDVLSSKDSKHTGALTYEETEAAFSELGAYNSLSHEQVRSIIIKVDAAKLGKVKISTLVTHIFGGQKSEKTDAADDITADSLLKLLLEGIQRQGVAIDAVFRHFDKDGNGQITKSELEQGLASLHIFDNVNNWRAQLPSIVTKFDSNGDGSVSLKEFFKYLGVVDYAPNIVQRMTKIFAAASEKGYSVKDAFDEFDINKDGMLDASELLTGLKNLGTFGEVSEIDANAVIDIFDKDGDKVVTVDEFTAFFSSRVGAAAKDRQIKRAEKVLFKFRMKMKSVRTKGAKLTEIFAHFDKDKGGTISKAELSKGLSAMKDFQDISETDLQMLMDSMQTNNGDITFKDFELFVDPDVVTAAPETLAAVRHEQFAVKVREIFRKALDKGLSLDELFSRIDKDKDGDLTVAEFRGILSKLKGFRDVAAEDIDYLVGVLDRNGDGHVTLSEFKAFISSENMTSPISEKDLSDREIFIRCMKRIGEPDGGVDALLAYMDEDEDGLISSSSLMRLLKREDVYTTKLTPESVAGMLEHMTKGGNISVPALLRFVDGKDELVSYSAIKPESADDTLAMPEYEFHRDPEVHALEKKLRGLGRVLAKKGMNVEDLFRKYDALDSGMIRRTEFMEVLSKMGLYILEQGRVLQEAGDFEGDPLRKQQAQQFNKLKGNGSSYAQSAPRAARRLVMSGSEAKEGDFKEHLESMALVNWYRQSQKKLMLQRVLSHSLASSVRIYPRFGKTLFFEFPITNPFSHEERFIVDINDPELRLVTSFDEWLHLRSTCRSATGELGPEPVEAEMFDRDGYGNVQVVLLPHETLHIPFTFMTLVPYKQAKKALGRKPSRPIAESKGGRDVRESHKSVEESKAAEVSDHREPDEDEEPSRTAEVRVISGSHGHVVSVLKVLVCPRPFAVHRTLRFFEPENSIMKRRIQLVDYGIGGNMFPGESSSVSKYVHCVESDDISGQSNVVIEWGPSTNGTSLDMLLRYRCGAFPNTGSFFLIIYNDAYQSHQHEVCCTQVDSQL